MRTSIEILDRLIVCLLGFACTGIAASQQDFPALDALKKSFGAERRTRVEQPRQDAVADLNSKYSAALERALETAQRAGKLDDALALKEEKDGIHAGGAIPEADKPDTPAVCKVLRATYRQTIARLDADRNRRFKEFVVGYVHTLDGAIQQLIRTGHLDEAKAARDEKENVGKELGKLAGAAEPPKTTAPPGPARNSKSRPQPKEGKIYPNDYFVGRVEHELDAAFQAAKEARKPVWIIVAGADDPQHTQHWRLCDFMDSNETKRLASEKFIQLLMPFTSASLKPYLGDGVPDVPLLLIVTASGELIENLPMNLNGPDALKRTKEIVEKVRGKR